MSGYGKYTKANGFFSILAMYTIQENGKIMSYAQTNAKEWG